MAVYILIALIGVPLIEIWVFIEIGGRLGALTTIAIVVLTAIVGTALLRQQGYAVLARVQASMAANQMPVAAVFDGLCLLVAGALLLTPGFVTDAMGLLLFVPVVRQVVGRWLLRRIIASGGLRINGGPGGRGTEQPDGPVPGGSVPGGPVPRGPVIDGDFVDVGESPEKPVPGDDEPTPPIDSRWGRRD